VSLVDASSTEYSLQDAPRIAPTGQLDSWHVLYLRGCEFIFAATSRRRVPPIEAVIIVREFALDQAWFVYRDLSRKDETTMADAADRERHNELADILEDVNGKVMMGDGSCRQRMEMVAAAWAWAFYRDLRACGKRPIFEYLVMMEGVKGGDPDAPDFWKSQTARDDLLLWCSQACRVQINEQRLGVRQ
jgi:hypothetical protein